MTVKHDKAWRAALKESGITAESVEAKIIEAWEHPNIPNEDVDDAKLAFQRSYLLFVQSVESGNTLLRELSMTEGQRAFDCGKLLHTKLTLEPEVMRTRSLHASQKKPRGSRRPLLDEWLRGKLKRGKPTNDELWDALPVRGDLYRDDDEVTELRSDETPCKPLKRAGFDKRVTAVLKTIRR
ncbi:MAG TPA: hypothetical protein PK743_11210 [Luteimonas sp.]|mgnify:CR=1 FL=1|nr:hypothetical protein [Luteimonas sp.]